MSEERLARIEAQIGELRELMQQNMATTQQNMNAMGKDVNILRQQIVLLNCHLDSTLFRNQLVKHPALIHPQPKPKSPVPAHPLPP
jgi:hypothetical protein